VEKDRWEAQHSHWEKTFSENPEMFGTEPSDPARKAAEIFKKGGLTRILELGSGQGRDTLFLARNGFQVYALDYSTKGLEAIVKKAQELGLQEYIKTKVHDVRNPLPFVDECFDGCFSHMLYCMALTTAELQFLSGEIRRVLRPRGINIYTVRHTGDPHYQTGIHRGEDMYEREGFIVHFFSKGKVELLAEGYKIISIEKFEEGRLPRRLFRVMLRKK